jgi:hypothetical protein
MALGIGGGGSSVEAGRHWTGRLPVCEMDLWDHFIDQAYEWRS